jgi:hypothetical protein
MPEAMINRRAEFEELFGFSPASSRRWLWSENFEGAVLGGVLYQFLIVRKSALCSSINHPWKRISAHLDEIQKFEKMTVLGSKFYPRLQPMLNSLKVPVAYQLPPQFRFKK